MERNFSVSAQHCSLLVCWFAISIFLAGHLTHCAPTMIACTVQFNYHGMGREADQDEFFYDVHVADAGFENLADAHQHELDLNICGNIWSWKKEPRTTEALYISAKFSRSIRTPTLHQWGQDGFELSRVLHNRLVGNIEVCQMLNRLNLLSGTAYMDSQ